MSRFGGFLTSLVPEQSYVSNATLTNICSISHELVVVKIQTKQNERYMYALGHTNQLKPMTYPQQNEEQKNVCTPFEIHPVYYVVSTVLSGIFSCLTQMIMCSVGVSHIMFLDFGWTIYATELGDTYWIKLIGFVAMTLMRVHLVCY